MNPITFFLEKFARLSPPEGIIRGALEKVSKQLLDIELKDEQIRFQRGVIFLDVNPIVRHEFALHKRELVDAVNAQLGSKRVVDIR